MQTILTLHCIMERTVSVYKIQINSFNCDIKNYYP